MTFQLLHDLGAWVRHLLPAHLRGDSAAEAEEGDHAADQDEAGRRHQAHRQRGVQGGRDGAGQRQGCLQPRLNKLQNGRKNCELLAVVKHLTRSKKSHTEV